MVWVWLGGIFQVEIEVVDCDIYVFLNTWWTKIPPETLPKKYHTRDSTHQLASTHDDVALDFLKDI